MTKKKFKVAILVSTYNWPDALELVFKGIFQQTVLPDEILVADDGSRDDTIQLVEKLKQSTNIPVKHAWHEDKGFRKSIVLNKAVKLSDADYIIEIDGDIIIDKRFVADHLKQAQKGFFVQGSRSMVSPQKTQEILKTKNINIHPLSRGLYTRFNSYRIPLLSRFYNTDAHNPFNVKGCNLAFWREDYINVNGYNNDFKGWGWEDYEFAARLINAGILKKRIKMIAIMYHLYHKVTSRASYKPNEVIYRKALDEKLTRCDNGYEQV